MSPSVVVGSGALIAMLIGFAGTSTIHLSKGVMKLGISRLRPDAPSLVSPVVSRRGAAIIYGIGIALNFTNPLWVIAANRFAPTIYYTSMYGLGLIALLIFSRFTLRESIRPRQVLGVLVIVFGTLVIGFTELSQAPTSLFLASRTRVAVVAGFWLIGAPIAAMLTAGSSIGIQEVVFGAAAGGLAALEAVVKGVAQAGATGSTFLPQNAANWVLFIVSFIGAAGAFAIIQWSFLRRCRAAMMGAVYTVSYVSVPLLVVPFLVGSSMINVGCVVGIVILAIGAVLVAGSAQHTGPTTQI